MGKDAWVQAELVRMVRGQDARLKLIVALARHVGPATQMVVAIGADISLIKFFNMAMPFFNGQFMPLNIYHCAIPR